MESKFLTIKKDCISCYTVIHIEETYELTDSEEYSSIEEALDSTFPNIAIVFVLHQDNEENNQYFMSKLEEIKNHNDKINAPIGILLDVTHGFNSDDFYIYLTPIGNIEKNIAGENYLIPKFSEFRKKHIRNSDGLWIQKI